MFVFAVLLGRCWTSSTASQLAHVGCCCPRIQFAGIVRLSLVRVVWTFGVVSASSPSAGPYSPLPPPGGTPHSLCGGTVPTTPAAGAAAACYLCLLHHRLISKSKAISSLFPDCPPQEKSDPSPPVTSKFPTTQTHTPHTNLSTSYSLPPNLAIYLLIQQHNLLSTFSNPEISQVAHPTPSAHP